MRVWRKGRVRWAPFWHTLPTGDSLELTSNSLRTNIGLMPAAVCHSELEIALREGRGVGSFENLGLLKHKSPEIQLVMEPEDFREPRGQRRDRGESLVLLLRLLLMANDRKPTLNSFLGKILGIGHGI